MCKHSQLFSAILMAALSFNTEHALQLNGTIKITYEAAGSAVVSPPG